MTILHTPDGAPVAATNRLPVELHGPDGAPLLPARRLAADNLALPTTVDVLSTPLVFDGANLDLARAIGLFAALAAADGVPASGHALMNAATGQLIAARNATRDSEAVEALPGVVPYAADGSRWRNNTEGVLLASAARTATTTASGPTNHNARGVVVFLNVTAASGTGGLQVTLRAVDPVSGASFQLNATPAAVVATGQYAYELYPGASGAAAGSVQQRTAAALPRRFELTVVHGDASSYTYSAGYALVV
jgi:hypothetical protein